MASVTDGRKLDIGRVGMVPLAAVLLIFDVAALIHRTAHGTAAAGGALRLASTALVCAFYAMIIWCYLRRGPAIATTSSALASVIAVLATNTVFVFPLLGGSPPGTARQLAADLFLVIGTSWSVISLRFLGKNLSVIAQARGVSDRGPYRFVRHPLYTGEIVSTFGLAIATGTVAGFAIWVAIVAMQVYRARQEEQVLLRALPGYQEYRARTAALVPGLF